MFARVVRAAAVAVKPYQVASATRQVAPRAFASHAILNKDIVTELYLKEIRAYKAPPEDKSAAAGLPETVSMPTPPAKPEFELAQVQAAGNEAGLEEEAWPALVDPIDDPHNYPDAWDYTCDKVDNLLMPTAVKAYDYHEGH
ncbi:hypothetical protein SmJEL517_g05246 [Synchytrium microbalum]|uniref:Uncharacterized protein n=1 Tax=Synchytrium microbalum TaxID=1806994 RepID=A0A507BW34_9FUNG|nr:uncharacterized protein SmJEL517_g05246 [Synchytrium microbalum]TPX31398.1 hypothetical protein SmJEL517_g05246 [Synchytrium microbalum]